MVEWKAYKVLYNIEPEQYEISFEEFKERLTSTMNENFGGLLEEGDIVGHDGYPPFYIWTNNGMYSIGTDPFRILWKHADSRNPEDILDFVETYPNLFYRYSKIGNVKDLVKDLEFQMPDYIKPEDLRKF